MKVGSFIYATTQGLGILAKDFYDNGVINKPCLIRHGSRHTHEEWYPSDTPQICSLRTEQAKMREFCADLDVLLIVETPFDWSLVNFCKENGVKTVLMPMYECMPEKHPKCDLTLCPSLLDQKYYPDGKFIPVPVKVNWKQRTQVETFIHNAGHGGLKGRNGTENVIRAMEHVRSRAKVVVRSQTPIPIPFRHNNLEVNVVELAQADLFSSGDAFLFPEKFNGLSLPLQEAYGAGMLVVATDRFPMNTWLPTEPLIPVFRYQPNRIGGCHPFEEAVLNPKDIAAKIDEWFGRDITEFSQRGRDWAIEHSWEKLGPVYKEAISNA